jgi:putative ABC transport system permease protein
MDYGSNAWTSKEAGGQGTRVLMTFAADYDFAKTFQIKMAEGRYYSKDHAVDTVTSIVINEAAAKELQLTKPYVGKQLVQINRTVETSRTFDVIGVVKDFNFESLHNNIRPMVIFLFRQGGFGRYVAAKVKPENIQSTLSYMKDTWEKFAGNQEFEYTFFDDDFAKIYESEQRTGKIFTSFSVLAIFIACLGLLGLAAFTTEQRTKEIGIRKAMGASISSILFLLSKEFAKWVVIANIIAWPLAYFVMNKWLQDFAYRIDIHFSIFFYSGIIALFIAVITVSTQALKAAMTNPVESLRYE